MRARGWLLVFIQVVACGAPEAAREPMRHGTASVARTGSAPSASAPASASALSTPAASALAPTTGPCQIAPVRRPYREPAARDGAPHVVKLTSEPRTFATPLIPGRFRKLEIGLGGGCLLDEDNELVCFTARERLPKRPKEAEIGVDSTNEVGSDVVPPGVIVAWGELSLPKGPFRDLSGTLESGCAITSEDHLACWGESKNVRSFATKLADRKIASVSVDSLTACAITLEGELICLEGLDGTPKPNRKLRTAKGRFAAVDVRGFDWAVTSDGGALRSEVTGDFQSTDLGAPGCFTSLVSDGFIACGLEARRARCLVDPGDIDPALAVASRPAERITPGHRYYCVISSGKATCFGDAANIPGGPLRDEPAIDVGGSVSFLCILDPEGALRCRGVF